MATLADPLSHHHLYYQSRGKSLKDLIKDKGPSAEVIVSLRNKGAEAYKPEIYGNKIYITRRITSEGSSNYKIAGSDRKTISTKRNELAAICDYFQIQVDNPVNVGTSTRQVRRISSCDLLPRFSTKTTPSSSFIPASRKTNTAFS